jgi:hypothetical protein
LEKISEEFGRGRRGEGEVEEEIAGEVEEEEFEDKIPAPL